MWHHLQHSFIINLIYLLLVDQVWEWLDEGGTWIPYTNTHCELLEDAHTNQQLDSVDLSVSGRGYSVDLTSMIQTNKSTGVTRQVRRVDDTDNKGARPTVGGKSATKRSKPIKQVTKTSKVAKGTCIYKKLYMHAPLP